MYRNGIITVLLNSNKWCWMKFLIIDGELLKNTLYTPTDKMIICYVHNLESSGKYFFGGIGYLANELGVAGDYLKKRFDKLIYWGILRADPDAVRMNLGWDQIVHFRTEYEIADALRDAMKDIAAKFSS